MGKNDENVGRWKADHGSEAANYEEFLAKYILEDLHPEWDFEKFESPDLKDFEARMGVEVVRAFPGWYNRYSGEFGVANVARMDGDYVEAEKHLDRCRKDLAKARNFGGFDRVIGNVDVIEGIPVGIVSVSGDLYETHKPLIAGALANKLEKLNSWHRRISEPEFRDLSRLGRMGLFIHTTAMLGRAGPYGLDKPADMLRFVFDVQEDACAEGNGEHAYEYKYDIVFLYSESVGIIFELDIVANQVRVFDVHGSDYNEKLRQLSRRKPRKES